MGAVEGESPLVDLAIQLGAEVIDVVPAEESQAGSEVDYDEFNL